jgi:hypothetical protein
MIQSLYFFGVLALDLNLLSCQMIAICVEIGTPYLRFAARKAGRKLRRWSKIEHALFKFRGGFLWTPEKEHPAKRVIRTRLRRILLMGMVTFC